VSLGRKIEHPLIRCLPKPKLPRFQEFLGANLSVLLEHGGISVTEHRSDTLPHHANAVDRVHNGLSWRFEYAGSVVDQHLSTQVICPAVTPASCHGKAILCQGQSGDMRRQRHQCAARLPPRSGYSAFPRSSALPAGPATGGGNAVRWSTPPPSGTMITLAGMAEISQWHHTQTGATRPAGPSCHRWPLASSPHPSASVPARMDR